MVFFGLVIVCVSVNQSVTQLVTHHMRV